EDAVVRERPLSIAPTDPAPSQCAGSVRMLKQAALGSKSHAWSLFTVASGTSTTIVVVSRPLPMTTCIGSDTRSRWLAVSQLVMPATVDGTVVMWVPSGSTGITSRQKNTALSGKSGLKRLNSPASCSVLFQPSGVYIGRRGRNAQRPYV